jgi:hypothetical protein
VSLLRPLFVAIFWKTTIYNLWHCGLRVSGHDMSFSWCHGTAKRMVGWKSRKRNRALWPDPKPEDPSSVLSNFHHVYMMDFLAGRHNSLSFIDNTAIEKT